MPGKAEAVTKSLVVVLLSCIMLFSLAAGGVQAQTIIEMQPGLYCAGIPSKDFKYRAAPESSGRQRQTNWCWAASIQMVLNFHGVDVTQEEIVQRIFGTLL